METLILDCPEVGEVFATLHCGGCNYELALTQGLLDHDRTAYGIGIRQAGSTSCFESACYGYSSTPRAAIVGRFILKEVAKSGQDIEILHPWVKARFDELVKRAAAKKALAELAAAKIRETAARKDAERKLALGRVLATPLPKRKRVEMTVCPHGAIQVQAKVSVFIGWGVYRIGNGAKSVFHILHIASGKRAGHGVQTLAEANNIVRGFLLAGIDGTQPQFSQVEMGLLRDVRVFMAGGDVPSFLRAA